jgi:hypothetical protein
MTVFGTVVHPGTGSDEDVFDVGQFGDRGLCRRVATELVSHDLARSFGTRGKHALEKSPGSRRVATLLQQDVEFGAVLIDCSSQQIRLAAQRHKQASRPGGLHLEPLAEPCVNLSIYTVGYRGACCTVWRHAAGAVGFHTRTRPSIPRSWDLVPFRWCARRCTCQISASTILTSLKAMKHSRHKRCSCARTRLRFGEGESKWWCDCFRSSDRGDRSNARDHAAI